MTPKQKDNQPNDMHSDTDEHTKKPSSAGAEGHRGPAGPDVRCTPGERRRQCGKQKGPKKEPTRKGREEGRGGGRNR